MDTIKEILENANNDISTILKHKDNKYLRNFMEAAFVPEKKLNLPEGDPPYKINQQHEQQLRGAFWQIAKKIDIFQRTDLVKLRQETLFVQALESLPEVEAKIFLACKDQQINKMYKKLTLASLQKVGYFG